MVLEVLKYILIVIGIVIVGAFIIYALANLMLAIVDPHGKDKKEQNNDAQRQIVYNEQKLIDTQPVKSEPFKANNYEEVQKNDVKDIDLDKARQEEEAINAIQSYPFVQEQEEVLDLDEINVDNSKNQPIETLGEENDDDIEALIAKILADSNEEEVEKEEPAPNNDVDERIKALQEELLRQREEFDAKLAKISEEKQQALEESVVEEDDTDEDFDNLMAEIENDTLTEEETEEVEEANDEIVEEENFVDEKVKQLEEQLELQRAEYEAKLAYAEAQRAELEKANAEKEEENKANAEQAQELSNEKIEELESTLAKVNAEKEALIQEKEALAKANEEKSGATLSLEEYEARLEILKERLKVNEKELKSVKKEYLPLAKIHKSWEKDKIKLRRKEAIVAKQKVVLYGVNNIADIDEEKAKKLSEDLDLLNGLRLSVEHCEEILKANEERFPILKNSYTILLTNNEHIKADIEECNKKIAELKEDKE